MSRITRETLEIFAGSAGAVAGGIGKFGSAQAGSPTFSTDPATIQALAAWLGGWSDAVIGGSKFPCLEDMNAVQYVLSYMSAYQFQEGIPEYDSGTTYYINSIVKGPGTMQLFGSLTNANQGNALPTAPASNANWKFLIDLNTFSVAGFLEAANNLSDVANPATSLLNLGIAQPEIGIAHGRTLAWASNTTINVSASSIILKNASGETVKASAPSVTLNSATTGANGLDTGAVANSTWYYLWGIYNPTTSTFASLMSLSSTAPTLPAGYTYSALLGVARTDGSAHFVGFVQYGNDFQYVVGNNLAVLPNMANGTAGTYNATTPTWAPVAVASFVPPIAYSIKLLVGGVWNGGSNSNVIAAPNNNYGGPLSTNPPLYSVDVASIRESDYSEVILESSNVYWASDAAGGFMSCVGFHLNI